MRQAVAVGRGGMAPQALSEVEGSTPPAPFVARPFTGAAVRRGRMGQSHAAEKILAGELDVAQAMRLLA